MAWLCTCFELASYSKIEWETLVLGDILTFPRHKPHYANDTARGARDSLRQKVTERAVDYGCPSMVGVSTACYG